MQLRIAAFVVGACAAAAYAYGCGAVAAQTRSAQAEPPAAMEPPASRGDAAAAEVCTTIGTEEVKTTVCGSGVRIIERCFRGNRPTSTKKRCTPS